nr:chaperone protein DnaJ 16-like [Tanacetum cinerariifolium]
TTKAEREDLEIDLSCLGTMNTMVAAFLVSLECRSRLLVLASVLKEAINVKVHALPLALGKPVSRKKIYTLVPVGCVDFHHLAFLECLKKSHLATKGDIHVAHIYKTMCTSVDDVEWEVFLNVHNLAAKRVVENLVTVVMTTEDIESDNAGCAVCKDEGVRWI